LDPDQTNSAAGGRPVRIEKDDDEEELTRSQIRNRVKKAKKLQATATTEQLDEGAEITDNKPFKEAKQKPTTTSKTDDTDDTSKSKVNGIPTAKSNSTKETAVQKPTAMTLPPPKTNGIHTPTSTPQIRKPTITNGIKSSPSPSSTPRSPPHPTPSPVPIPSPTSISELRARLAARISQARIARKAIGTSVPGAPQTREAILLARQKRKTRVEEKIRAKKAAAKRTTVDQVKSEESSDEEISSGLKFGRVLVDDVEIDAGRGEVKIPRKKKGISDPKGRLEHLVAREERLAKLDPEKKAVAVENDRWHSALLSARGEKVWDDPALLKKSIARREREKKKSTKEWNERLAKVEKGKEERQKKRDDNIAKRREEKGKGKVKSKVGKKPVIKKKRPGFEGGRVKVGRK
jgi:hypothetical protein